MIIISKERVIYVEKNTLYFKGKHYHQKYTARKINQNKENL